MKNNRKNRKLYAINLKREYLELLMESRIALLRPNTRPERNRLAATAFKNLYNRGFGLPPARRRNSLHYNNWGVSVSDRNDIVTISLENRRRKYFKHSFKEPKYNG